MKTILSLLLAAGCFAPLASQAQSLAVGDPAPEVKASQWIKGTPVDALSADTTYVLEFWATWCGPCLTAIPHVTELARRYPNVAFIGMNVWEKGKSDKVVEFVNHMGDKMDYAVAIDTDDGHMAKQWMEAAGQNGIPASFVVHQGRIAWMGHPMGGLDQVLKDIAAGTFDVEQVRARAAAEQRVEAFYRRAAAGATDEELAEEGQALEALDAELGGILGGGVRFQTRTLIQSARFDSAMKAYQAALIDEADAEEISRLEAVARAAAPDGTDFDSLKAHLQAGLEQRQARRLLGHYMRAASADGGADQAAELAPKIEALDLDPQTLNNFAWTILTGEDLVVRDLPFATRLAKKAVEATEGQIAYVLDTYARALFDSGQIAEALDVQQQAATLDPDDADIAATLQRYQAAADGAD
jgi:thiol-disulfide isomerase/thioredoxin